MKFKIIIFILIAILLFGILITFKRDDIKKESIYSEIHNEETFRNGVNIYVDNIALSKDKNELELVISNIGDKKISFGVDYSMEEKINNIWYEVPFKEDTMFIEIANILDKGESTSEIISLYNFKYSLKNGEYRVIKRFYVDGKEVIGVAEFSIK